MIFSNVSLLDFTTDHRKNKSDSEYDSVYAMSLIILFCFGKYLYGINALSFTMKARKNFHGEFMASDIAYRANSLSSENGSSLLRYSCDF